MALVGSRSAETHAFYTSVGTMNGISLRCGKGTVSLEKHFLVEKVT